MAKTASSGVHRLNHASEFDTVFKQATYRTSCNEFLLLAVENDRSISRLGMVVSKRVAGTSVNRNRIRRLIRESFRLGFDVKGLDIVIVARPTSGKMENARMNHALTDMWSRLSATLMRKNQ